MLTSAHGIFQILVTEGFCTSIEDMPKDHTIRDPGTWYAVSCLKMPDFADCPNNFIAVLDADYIQADRSKYTADGIPLEQSNVKICVRSTDYVGGLTKIHHIARTLDTLQNYSIAIPSDNLGEFDNRNNIPRSAEIRTALTCSRLETIRDRGLDGSARRYLFDVTYSVRFV